MVPAQIVVAGPSHSKVRLVVTVSLFDYMKLEVSWDIYRVELKTIRRP